jgi:hypothetical protein
VVPSGVELATVVMAMVPDAPVLFSTMTGVDKAFDNFGATILATISLPEPEVVGTKSVMVLLLTFCALTHPTKHINSHAQGFAIFISTRLSES